MEAPATVPSAGGGARLSMIQMRDSDSAAKQTGANQSVAACYHCVPAVHAPSDRVCAECSDTLQMVQNMCGWFERGAVSVSAQSLCTALLFDATVCIESAPRDAEDFERCLALVQRVPQLRQRLHRMIQLDTNTEAPGVIFRRPEGWRWWIEQWDALERATPHERAHMIAVHQGNCRN